MWIAIRIVAGLAAILVFLLFVPVEVTGRIELHGKPRLKMRLVWFFGWFDKELTRQDRPKKKKARKFDFRNLPQMLDIVRVRGLVRQAKDLVFDVILALKFSDMRAEYRIGLGNPACTGMLFGILAPAEFVINRFSPVQVDLRPSWEEKFVLEGDMEGKAKLLPVQLFIPVMKFIFSRAAFTTAVKVVRSKWRKKKS